MKLSTLARGFLLASGSVALLGSFTSCGNTMYGFGLDMERAGRRLQTSNDPNNAYSYQGGSTYAPQAQPAPQQNYSGY